MKFQITNLSTGKTRTVDIDFKKLGKKSAEKRHKGKSKKEISEMYSKLRKSNPPIK